MGTEEKYEEYQNGEVECTDCNNGKYLEAIDMYLPGDKSVCEERECLVYWQLDNDAWIERIKNFDGKDLKEAIENAVILEKDIGIGDIVDEKGVSTLIPPDGKPDVLSDKVAENMASAWAKKHGGISEER